ncbi:hypothetical protein TAL182_CH02595 [Rhizobium sp. TAL182]|nr:hypothetical protein TAL182_CH02595 [Rhizobium sp. TAL182]
MCLRVSFVHAGATTDPSSWPRCFSWQARRPRMRSLGEGPADMIEGMQHGCFGRRDCGISWKLRVIEGQSALRSGIMWSPG